MNLIQNLKHTDVFWRELPTEAVIWSSISRSDIKTFYALYIPLLSSNSVVSDPDWITERHECLIVTGPTGVERTMSDPQYVILSLPPLLKSIQCCCF